MLPLHDLEFLDAFSLAWTLTKDPTLPRPSAVLATLPPGPLAGPAVHLRTALREWLPGTLVAPVLEADLPPNAPAVTVRSDGVRVGVDLA